MSGAAPWRYRSSAPSAICTWGRARFFLTTELVLATGADALIPSPDYVRFSNTFVLRRVDDAQAVRMWVQQNSARKAVVIGGGVLGVEAAESLHHLGIAGNPAATLARLMDRHLDYNGAQRLARYLSEYRRGDTHRSGGDRPPG